MARTEISNLKRYEVCVEEKISNQGEKLTHLELQYVDLAIHNPKTPKTPPKPKDLKMQRLF